jgi:hypothetical protein
MAQNGNVDSLDEPSVVPVNAELTENTSKEDAK